jgi:hypothetical protein
VGFQIDGIPKAGGLSSSDLGTVKEMRSVDTFESGCAGLILGFCLYLIRASRVSLGFYAHASGDYHRFSRTHMLYIMHQASGPRKGFLHRGTGTNKAIYLLPRQAYRYIW